MVHAIKVVTARPSTAGANHAETRSASRWMGASLSVACSTSRMICARSVSAPTRSARKTKEPVVLSVPALTFSPDCLATGSGSPVSMDSSISARPSVRMPSTGRFSPGRTRRRSPGRTEATGTSSSVPSVRTRCAVGGVRCMSARMAASVRECARCSRICPSSTMVVMNAAASKYSGTPWCVRYSGGKNGQRKTAAAL